jgi:hypothetical protein
MIKRILTYLFLITTPLSSAQTAGKEVSHFSRITYYTEHGGPVACPRSKIAITGITIAAHPDFKIGTRVFIPALKNSPIDDDGIFVVQDRGPAVTSKKASRGKRYVFDVCINPKDKRMLKFAQTMSENMDVFILPKE